MLIHTVSQERFFPVGDIQVCSSTLHLSFEFSGFKMCLLGVVFGRKGFFVQGFCCRCGYSTWAVTHSVDLPGRWRRRGPSNLKHLFGLTAEIQQAAMPE